MIALRLDPDDVHAIAERVAELLGRGALPAASERWLSTAEVAAAFGRSPEWVRDHAPELGGRKIGGPRAPWRFPVSCLDAGVDRATTVPEPPAPARRRRASGRSVALLPIRS
jgi:hypothetical protein